MKNRSIFAIILILILSAPFVGQAQEAEEPELICESFTDSPADVRVSYYMGEGAAFFASSQLGAAVHSFSCVVEQIDTGYVPGFLSRAIVYTEQRNYDLAIEDYTSAIGLDSGLIPAFNNRGIVQVAKAEYDLALEDFNRVLELDGSNILGLTNRAVVYALQGEYELAIADLEQAIDLSDIESVVEELSDPERPADAPFPEFDRDHAQAYALLGIIYSQHALENYRKYLLLTGSRGDFRIQSAAGALESRFTFELRLEDGTWLLAADFVPGEEL
jgi:tetratricopeptide (TPR) repeat protein